jgi:hypothetical protein
VAAFESEEATVADQSTTSEARAREAQRARAEAEIEQTKREVAALLERIKAEQALVRERRGSDESTRGEVIERLKEQGLIRERTAAELRATREPVEREVQRMVEERLKSRNAEIAETVGRLNRERVAERSQQRLMEVLPERQRLAMSLNEEAVMESQLADLEQALARQKALVEKGLTTRDTQERLERQLDQMREAVERSRTLARRLEQSGVEREMRVAGVELGEARLGTVLDSSAVLEQQDRLTITIEGEPDLPRVFTVRPDGSIRFPFLGSIRVQGSTTAQVQSVIRKLLSDRGLVSNPEVKVSAQRRR